MDEIQARIAEVLAQLPPEQAAELQNMSVPDLLNMLSSSGAPAGNQANVTANGSGGSLPHKMTSDRYGTLPVARSRGQSGGWRERSPIGGFPKARGAELNEQGQQISTKQPYAKNRAPLKRGPKGDVNPIDSPLLGGDGADEAMLDMIANQMGGGAEHPNAESGRAFKALEMLYNQPEQAGTDIMSEAVQHLSAVVGSEQDLAHMMEEAGLPPDQAFTDWFFDQIATGDPLKQ